MNSLIFSSNLKQIRMNKGISQTTLSKQLKMSKVIISCYESGKRVPSLKHLIEIAKYFKVSIDYLVGINYEFEEEYLNDLMIFKMIKRSKIISSFLLKDKRENIKLLEDYIEKFNESNK